MGGPQRLGNIEQQESADSTMTEHINYRIGNVDQAGKIKDDLQLGRFKSRSAPEEVKKTSQVFKGLLLS